MPAVNFRFSSNSRQARALGCRLLELTDPYSDLRVPNESPIPLLVELALVSRARHLLESAYREADVGDDYSATILLRALNEAGMTLAWLMIDPELAAIVMRLDEIRTRLNHHAEYARLERNERATARRRGDGVRPLEPGATLGLLDRSSVRRFKSLDVELRQQAEKLPRVQQRKKRLGVKQLSRVPGFDVRAKKSRNPWLYTAAYRFDTNSAGHPTLLGLQQFVDSGKHDEIVIRDSPEGSRPDPYDAGAVLMGVVAQLASGREGHPVIDTAELEAIEVEIRSFNRS